MARSRRTALHLRIFFMLAFAVPGDGYNCPYGHKCGFDPAPPGKTPPCAQPGLTYCLHPDPYPESVIRRLVEAGQYNIRTLLSDESRDDFGASREYPYGYGPNSLPHVDQISLVDESLYKDYNKYHWLNHGPHSDKAPLQPPSVFDPSPYNKGFQPANYSKLGYQGFQPEYFNPTNPYDPTNYDYERRLRQSGQPLDVFNPNYFNTPPAFPQQDWLRQGSRGVTQYSPREWWKYLTPSHSDAGVTIQRSVSFPPQTLHERRRRNAELVKESSKRTLTGAEALRIALGLANEDSAERPRRQASDEAEQLCRVRTEFITPQAAVNIRGNWKYVVNMRDNMTQLVRAEICVSTECSGLCTLQNGYSSRCEQKYIQKRLVALESGGQNLYTDIFWIPSCCQCTITSNN